MDGFSWENLNRNHGVHHQIIGLSCKCSHHLILWIDWFDARFSWRKHILIQIYWTMPRCLDLTWLFGERTITFFSRVLLLWEETHFCDTYNLVFICSWLVVWTPLKNISQLGWLFPIYGKIKNGNQTTNQVGSSWRNAAYFTSLNQPSRE